MSPIRLPFRRTARLRPLPHEDRLQSTSCDPSSFGWRASSGGGRQERRDAVKSKFCEQGLNSGERGSQPAVMSNPVERRDRQTWLFGIDFPRVDVECGALTTTRRFPECSSDHSQGKLSEISAAGSRYGQSKNTGCG